MTGLNTYLPEAHCNAITRRGESWKLFIIYHSTVINYPQLYTCHEDSKVQCYENLSYLLGLLPKNSLNACFWNIWAWSRERGTHSVQKAFPSATSQLYINLFCMKESSNQAPKQYLKHHKYQSTPLLWMKYCLKEPFCDVNLYSILFVTLDLIKEKHHFDIDTICTSLKAPTSMQ